MNSKAAAGAGPIPSSSRTMTSGNLEQQRDVDQHAHGGRYEYGGKCVPQVLLYRAGIEPLDHQSADEAGPHHDGREPESIPEAGPHPVLERVCQRRLVRLRPSHAHSRLIFGPAGVPLSGPGDQGAERQPSQQRDRQAVDAQSGPEHEESHGQRGDVQRRRALYHRDGAPYPAAPAPVRRRDGHYAGGAQVQHRSHCQALGRARNSAPGRSGRARRAGEQERLSQARHQESKHHTCGDQPEIGGGKLPPRRQQARIGRGLGAETLEAWGLCP